MYRLRRCVQEDYSYLEMLLKSRDLVDICRGTEFAGFMHENRRLPS